MPALTVLLQHVAQPGPVPEPVRVHEAHEQHTHDVQVQVEAVVEVVRRLVRHHVRDGEGQPEHDQQFCVQCRDGGTEVIPVEVQFLRLELGEVNNLTVYLLCNGSIFIPQLSHYRWFWHLKVILHLVKRQLTAVALQELHQVFLLDVERRSSESRKQGRSPRRTIVLFVRTEQAVSGVASTFGTVRKACVRSKLLG